jgi:small subunit ribosomal protein S13
MARIAGIELPNRRIIVGLQYIYGVGPYLAREILREAEIDESTRANSLSEDQSARIRSIIERSFKVEGDLRRERGAAIKRLMDMGCYRGLRHRKGLPARGQRTRTNARTRKGPRKQAITGKKKATKK